MLSCPPSKQLASFMGVVDGWTPVSDFMRVTPYSDDWASVSAALRDGAAAYHAKFGRPAVLVIDGADLIAKNDEKFFGKLQGFAKTCADERHLRVVFVFSDGVALPLLQKSSAYSRCAPPLEVGDVSDSVAVGYLVQRDVPKDRATQAVRQLTGGRFYLLSMVAGWKGPDLDSLRDALDNNVARK